MSLLVFIWYLFSLPSDRLVCSMWVQQPPSRAAMNAAGCVWSAADTSRLVLRGLDLYTGQVMCERPAAQLPTLTCDLWPLDHYILRVYEPDHRDQLCTVSILHSGVPTAAEISAQCPARLPPYTLELATSGPLTPPVPPDPICPLPKLSGSDLPGGVQYLATAKDYQLLAYHLRWYYGSDAAMPAWQNQFDRAIYAAGLRYNVPPWALKGLFAQESQFWPAYDAHIDPQTDEVGIGQLTDDGADLVLRYSPALYDLNCPIAIWDVRCPIGYDLLTAAERRRVRDVLRRSLSTDAWWPNEAARQAQAQIPTWAQVLAAYYCAAGEIVRPGGYSPSWDYALAAYHAGPECVRGGDICPAGQDYIQEVKQ
jgi:hypothetical protein